MPGVYATPEELEAYTGQPAPSDAERLLARASSDIEAATVTAVYDTGPDGMPTDADVRQAMSDATCAQVEYWQATGDDGTGAAGMWDSVSIGPVSLGGRVGRASDTSGLALAPRALRALSLAGLVPGVIL